MAAKKQKKKARNKKVEKKGMFARCPKVFLLLGGCLVMTSVCLLSTGYQSHAKVGLAMLSLFFGMSLVIFANASLSRH